MLNQDPTQRLPALTLDAMRRRGVPSAVAFMMEHLLNHRAVSWPVETSTIEQQRLNDLWDNLQYVRSGEDLVAWGGGLREFLWGSTQTWETFAQQHGPDEQQKVWARAKRLIGQPVLTAIKDHDHWRSTWSQAAAADYPSMERAQQDRLLRRRAEYPESAIPPETLSVAMVNTLAENLQDRFGLTHLVAAGSLSLEDTWHHLHLAEEGLTTLAQCLDWPEEAIGAHRLGLSFELAQGNMAAHYDSFSRSINVALAGWGCFAHEWGHALDHALGETWLPRAAGPNRYGSLQAVGDYAHYPDEFREDRAAMRSRSAFPKGAAHPVTVARRAVEQLPLTLAALLDDAPSPLWKSLAHDQVQALNAWLGKAFDPLAVPTTVHAQWRRWKAATEAWQARTVDDPAGRDWLDDWNEATQTVEMVAFDTLPTTWSWQALARARDQLNKTRYWSAPHEEWARSFHAYVRHRVGRDSWLADRTDRPDQFPQGVELAREAAWWQEHLPRWRQTWAPEVAKPSSRPPFRSVSVV